MISKRRLGSSGVLGRSVLETARQLTATRIVDYHYLSSQDFMATGNIPRHIVLTGLPGENDIGLRLLATVPTNAVPQPT